MKQKTPDRVDFTLSGDRLAEFKTGLHRDSPKWRLLNWKDILLIFQDKSPLDVKGNRLLEMVGTKYADL